MRPAKRLIPLPVFAVLSIFVGSCGFGPAPESRVASAIQTLMANLIEGSFPTLGGGGSGPIDCGVSGTFAASDPNYGTVDPLNPSATEISTPIVFDNCVVKICDSTVSLNGAGTSIKITLGDLTGVTGAESNSASIQVEFTDQLMSGVIEGTVSFNYKMTTTVSNNTLESIVIEDTDPAEPLTYQGKSFNGADLAFLADGC